eukprot:CAMPEP_0114338746 /NCGR_PEP_ID=MMETSP0101-20121206/7244_1 /TAXON_ID=38822 ORGANISM="Pteridomonas danica, Strain PT" /NCGR_SAMPLE_ID=MMETSP0101 /ASSEMBLY_ACC=CAM_ASM_000211 /LENGTH=895 /DNA_ID=CAMNT_0001471435 /DNA_START=503 /DNA_END=3192 /DNA_ORIENTATION=+
MALCMWLAAYASRWLKVLQAAKSKDADARMETMGEAVGGGDEVIAWEAAFEDKIKNLRFPESQKLWQFARLRLLTTALSLSTPAATLLAMLATRKFLLPHDSLGLSATFTAVALVGTLQAPLSGVSDGLACTAQLKVALIRLEKFLLQQDKPDNIEPISNYYKMYLPPDPSSSSSLSSSLSSSSSLSYFSGNGNGQTHHHNQNTTKYTNIDDHAENEQKQQQQPISMLKIRTMVDNRSPPPPSHQPLAARISGTWLFSKSAVSSKTSSQSRDDGDGRDRAPTASFNGRSSVGRSVLGLTAPLLVHDENKDEKQKQNIGDNHGNGHGSGGSGQTYMPLESGDEGIGIGVGRSVSVDGDPFALKEVSLNIPKGKLTIVCGATGSGKSSLLLGLLGELEKYDSSQSKLYLETMKKSSPSPSPYNAHNVTTPTSNHSTRPSSSSITIDYKFPRIAYVPQDAFIFNGTLKDNITFFTQSEYPIEYDSYHIRTSRSSSSNASSPIIKGRVPASPMASPKLKTMKYHTSKKQHNHFKQINENISKSVRLGAKSISQQQNSNQKVLTPLDEVRYQEALYAAALGADLASLPAGDATEVGSKGLNLSGGQKQRISMGRALFSDAPLFLMDDPLSAVDSHVAKHLWEHAIKPLVGPPLDSHDPPATDSRFELDECNDNDNSEDIKTVVLVTNSLALVASDPAVHQIVVMDHCSIIAVGNYQSLVDPINGCEQFKKLLETFSSEQDDENDENDTSVKKDIIMSDDVSDDVSDDQEEEEEEEEERVEAVMGSLETSELANVNTHINTIQQHNNKYNKYNNANNNNNNNNNDNDDDDMVVIDGNGKINLLSNESQSPDLSLRASEDVVTQAFLSSEQHKQIHQQQPFTKKGDDKNNNGNDVQSQKVHK